MPGLRQAELINGSRFLHAFPGGPSARFDPWRWGHGRDLEDGCRDLGIKLDLYRRTGVREYLTVLLNPQRVIWRQLVRGRYREIAPSEDGLLKSRIFPGLWLDPAALWNRRRSIRTALQRGVRSPEHAAFVLTLAARAKRRKHRT